MVDIDTGERQQIDPKLNPGALAFEPSSLTDLLRAPATVTSSIESSIESLNAAQARRLAKNPAGYTEIPFIISLLKHSGELLHCWHQEIHEKRTTYEINDPTPTMKFYRMSDFHGTLALCSTLLTRLTKNGAFTDPYHLISLAQHGDKDRLIWNLKEGLDEMLTYDTGGSLDEATSYFIRAAYFAKEYAESIYPDGN